MAKGRILAIDDENFFRRFYQDLLGAEGYLVRTAASGEEALEVLKGEPFDLIITDMQMPGMDGLATAEAIRRLNPDQEVMVVTAHKDVEKAVATMKSGVSEYLLKPINPEEFLHVVNRILFGQTLRSEHGKLVRENIELSSILSTFQNCLKFLRVEDLDRLGDLILDTLMELLKAEGGVLWLAGYRGINFRRHCLRGLARVSGAEEVLTPGEQDRRIILAGEPALAAGGKKVWIPLCQGVEPVALVQMEAPMGRPAFGPRDLKVAAAASEFAASALSNVLRYRSLEQKSLRADQGMAYNMAFFRDFLDKELQTARRYGRNLSLLRLSVDNYPELKVAFREKELELGITQMLGKVQEVLRDADIMAMVSPSEYYMLLPETDFWGSLMTQKRIRKALKDLSLSDMRRSLAVQTAVRGASFPVDGHNFEELSQVLTRRLARLKESLFQKGAMQAAPFWSAVEQILGTPKDYRFNGGALQVSKRLAAFEDGLQSRFFRMSADRFEEVLRAFCREVVESCRTRGIIYRGCGDFDQVRKGLSLLEAQERSATTLYLLGGDRRVHWDVQKTVPIHIEEPQFRKYPFLIYLTEDQAYALFAHQHKGELIGFHTSDFYFVENMIAKLQEQYQLQTQI